jgi:thioredoxin reductase (NADPH)
MFPVLSEAEIDRVRRFGEVKRFPAGELLFQAGEAVPGMYVILSGRVAIVPRDGLGQAVPVATFAQMIGAPVEEMTEVVPGEVIAEIGQLSGRPDSSVLDARAVGDVEAIVVPPESLRALLVAEAELGERILRALILRRVALIELGFGGPVLVGALKSPDVTRLSHFLERNAIPFRVVNPDEDRDASALLARLAAQPGELPMAVLPDGTVLKNPTKHELARALGLVAASFRSEPYDVAIVGAGPAGLATAVYGASEGLSVVVLEALAFGGQAGTSARIENLLGFPTGISGQALMARAFTQAQKFGAEFSLSTEVTQLDCISERSGPDPVHILALADGRHIRARAVVIATGARYRRPEIPNLSQFEGRGVSYWASPIEARLCRNEDVALLGGGNSAGQAAVFLGSHARQVNMLVRGQDLSITMSRYLVDRIAASPNIAVFCETEIVELHGTPDHGLQRVRWRNRRTGHEEQHAIAHCSSSPVLSRPRPGSPARACRSTGRALFKPAPTCLRPSECHCRWRPGSKGSLPSATSAAGRRSGSARPSAREPRSSRSCTRSSPGVVLHRPLPRERGDAGASAGLGVLAAKHHAGGRGLGDPFAVGIGDVALDVAGVPAAIDDPRLEPQIALPIPA